MKDFLLRVVETKDIPLWLNLSHEFDLYIKELVGILSQWYDGNEHDIAFSNYMELKIAKKEAIMAVGNNGTDCLGIIAFSKNYNRITFFGVSHNADFDIISILLIDYALSQLDMNKQISVNIIKSNADIWCKKRMIFAEYGFVFSNSELENGVPVDKFCRV